MVFIGSWSSWTSLAWSYNCIQQFSLSLLGNYTSREILLNWRGGQHCASHPLSICFVLDWTPLEYALDHHPHKITRHHFDVEHLLHFNLWSGWVLSQFGQDLSGKSYLDIFSSDESDLLSKVRNWTIMASSVASSKQQSQQQSSASSGGGGGGGLKLSRWNKLKLWVIILSSFLW